jgi:hypothetical protein
MTDQRFTAAPQAAVGNTHQFQRINAVLAKSKYSMVPIFFAAGIF